MKLWSEILKARSLAVWLLALVVGPFAFGLTGPSSSLPVDSARGLNSVNSVGTVTIATSGGNITVSDLTTWGVLGHSSGNSITVSYSGSPVKVYWGVTSCGFSADGSGISGGESMAYSSGDSSLSAGYVEYRGSTSITYYDGSWKSKTLTTRLKVTVTSGNNQAVALSLGSSVGASAPVVIPMTAGTSYRVQMVFQVYDGGWTAGNDYYDAKQTQSWVGTGYSLSYGYFYDRGPTSVGLDNIYVSENSDGAVYVGRLSSNDQDSDSTRYQIVTDDTAGGSSGYAIISGDELWMGRGFRGSYWNNTSQTGTTYQKQDSTIDFDWGVGSPFPGSIGTDNVSFRWTGQVVARVAGYHRFRTTSDDGVRLSVDGTRVIDNWTNHAPTDDYSGSVYFNQGQRVNLQMDGFEGGGGATMRLYWLEPGESVYKPVPGGFSGQPFFDYETNSSYTVKVRVIDSAGQSVDQSLGIAISNVNEAPYIKSQASATTVDEDFAAFDLFPNLDNNFGDPETPNSLTYAVSVSPALFTVTSVNGSRTQFRATPVANANGTATVTVTARDSAGLTATMTSSVTIRPVNDAPALTNQFSQVTGDEDLMSRSFTLSSYFGDVDGDTLTYSVASTNGVGTTNYTDIVRASISGGTLTLTGGPDRYGNAEVRVRATDPGGLSATGTITVTINPINDAPVGGFSSSYLTNNAYVVAANEDAGSVVINGFGVNMGPGGWSEVQTLSASVVSNSNTNLFDSGPSLSPDASTQQATLSFRSKQDAYGDAVVQFRLSDNGSGTSPNTNSILLPSVTIRVLPVNDPPSFDAISDQVTDEQPQLVTFATPLIRVPITGISPGPNEPTDAVTNISSVIISNSVSGLVTFDHVDPIVNSTSTLYYALGQYINGTSQIRVTLIDRGGATNARTFKLTVRSVDHPPVVGTNFPTKVALLEDATGFTVRVDDAFKDLDGDAFTQLTADSSDLARLQVTTVLDGTTNKGIRGSLRFSAQPNMYTISPIRTNDPIQVNVTAAAGGIAISRAIPVTITEVNDPPSMDPIGNIITDDSGGTRVVLTGLSPGPLESDFDSVDTNSFRFTSSNPGLVDPATMYATNINLSIGRGQMRFFPRIPSSGTVVLSVAFGDKRGARTTNAFNVQINHVNHAPTLASPLPAVFANAPVTGSGRPTITIDEDSPPTLLSLAGLFADPDGDLPSSSLFGNTNSALITAYTTNVPPNTLVLIPAGEQNGRSEITLRGSDGLQEAFFTFAVEVRPINDAPYMDAIARQRVNENSGTNSVTISGVRAGPLNETGQKIVSITTEVLDQSVPGLISATRGDYGALNLLPLIPTATVYYTTGTDLSGNARLRVTIQDDGGTDNGGTNVFSREFIVVVDPVSLAPRIARQPQHIQVLEDQFVADGGRAQFDFPGLFLNPHTPAVPPELVVGTITDPQNVLRDEVGGGVRIPPTATESLQLTFNPDAFGSATVQLRAYGSGLLSSDAASVIVDVIPVNDPPSFSPIPDQFLQEAAKDFAITIRNIRPGPNNESDQWVTNISASVLNSSVDGLLSVSSVDFQPGGTNAVLKLVGTPNAYGDATIRVIAQDNGGTENGGIDTFTNDFTVFVSFVDDKPKLVRPLPVLEVLEDQFDQFDYRTTIDLSGYFADPEGSPVGLVLRRVNDPKDILDEGGIRVEQGLPEVLDIRFKPDAFGEATIELAARAESDTSDDTGILLVRVLPVNDPPYLDAISSMSVENGRRSNVVQVASLRPGTREESIQLVTNVTATVLSESTPGLIALTGGAPFIPGSSTTQLYFDAATNKTGLATIQVRAMDNGGTLNGGANAYTREFTVTVTDSDDPPWLITPTNYFEFSEAFILTNTVLQLRLTNIFGAERNAPIAYIVDSAEDMDDILIDESVRFLPKAADVLELPFHTNVAGVATLNIRAIANRLVSQSVHKVVVRITPVNQRPTLDPIRRQIVTMNSGSHDVPLTGISSGVNEEDSAPPTLTYQILSETSPGMVKDIVLKYTGGGLGLFTYGLAQDVKGTTSIRIFATDAAGLFQSRDFRVVVIDGDDPPVLISNSAKVTLLEDQFSPTADMGLIDLRGLFFDPEGNPIQVVVIPASVNDPGDVLADEQELPRADLDNGEMLRLRLRPDRSGTISFNVLGMANGLVSTNAASVQVNVLPVNDPPTISAIRDVAVLENAAPFVIDVPLGAVGPADEASQRIVAVTAQPEGTASLTIIDHIDVQFSPGGSSARLTVNLKPNRSGVAFVRVNATDDGGTDNGGQDTASTLFAVRVADVDHAPVLLAGQENVLIALTSDQVEAFNYMPQISFDQVFSDPDGDPFGVVVVGRKNADGILDDSKPDSVTPLPENPSVLRLRLRPGYFGVAELQVRAAALGRSSDGTATVIVQVTPPLGAPSFDAIADVNVLQDATVPDIAVTGIRPGVKASGATKVASVSARVLSAQPEGLVSRLDAIYTPGSPTARISLATTPGLSGSAVLAVRVEDDGAATDTRTNAFERQVTFRVAKLNELARATTNRVDFTFLEDQFARSGRMTRLNLAGVFVDGDNDPITLRLLSAGFQDPQGVLDDELGRVYVDPLNPESIIIGLGADASGDAVLRVTAVSGGLQTSDVVTVRIHVLPVNDAPRMDAIQPPVVSKVTSVLDIPVTGIVPGPVSESSQTVQSLTAVLASQQPAGTMRVLGVDYVPGATVGTVHLGLATNVLSGLGRLVVTLKDDGGVANGGVDSTSAQVDVTVNITREPPHLAAPIGTRHLLEDSLATAGNLLQVSLDGVFISQLGDKPVLSIVNIDDPDDVLNNERSDGVVIANGDQTTLKALVRANAFGSATVTYRALGGGQLSTETDTLTIVVDPVNDSPTFSLPSTLKIQQGPDTVSFRATSINVGPRETKTQSIASVTAAMVSSDQADLMAGPAQVVLNRDTGVADISVPINPARNGHLTLRVRVSDDGGTANGGVDFAERQIAITVSPVDHPPVLVTPIGATNLTTAQVDGLVEQPLLIPLDGHFTDPDGDAITYFVVEVIDPQDILKNENIDGVTVVTNAGHLTLSLGVRTNRVGTATVEYLAIANGQPSASSDILTITVANGGELPRLAGQSRNPAAQLPKLYVWGDPSVGNTLSAVRTGVLLHGGAATTIRWEVCDNDLWIGAHAASGGDGSALLLTKDFEGRFVRAVATLKAGGQDPLGVQEVASEIVLVGRFQGSFETWAASRFGGAFGASEFAADADPDGDGLVNLAEYALGLDPYVANSGIMPVWLDSSSDGKPHVKWGYVAAKGRSDVLVEAMVSEDLFNWVQATDVPQILAESAHSAFMAYDVAAESKIRFWRLRVTRLVDAPQMGQGQ